MEDQAVLLATAGVVAIAWIPVLLRFFRSWRQRGNPLSFAICVLILFAIYIAIYIPFGILLITAPPPWPTTAMLVIDGLCCLTFYVTARLADRKFPGTRTRGA